MLMTSPHECSLRLNIHPHTLMFALRPDNVASRTNVKQTCKKKRIWQCKQCDLPNCQLKPAAWGLCLNHAYYRKHAVGLPKGGCSS
eukprot:3971214-Amphidinium_carterae.3